MVMLVRALLFLALRSQLGPCWVPDDFPVPVREDYQQHVVYTAEVRGVAARVWYEKARPEVLQVDVRKWYGWEPDRGSVSLLPSLVERMRTQPDNGQVIRSYAAACDLHQRPPLFPSKNFYGIY